MIGIGDKLGPYEILSPIGEGGMGEVWKARDTRLDRTVAVKVSKSEFTERFEREARAVAALNHPNICQLYDVGPNYLVMELIDGEPIKGPLPIEKAIAHAGQILDALDAAHKKGITHRDLKPANILVTKQGIKLLDFGLAKQAAGLKQADATLTSALTSQGQILGTLQYMSPEQLQGKEADARSDIFSFGCVLYELIGGKRAFTGESAASVIAGILEREPAPLEIAPPLDRVIKTCLAKDPDQRFQTALDLKRALAWAMEQAPTTKTSTPSMLPWIVAACLAVVAAVALSSRAPRTEADCPMLRLDADLSDEFAQPAISPDGLRVAFVSKGQLAVRRLDGASVVPLEGTAGASLPFFSPDGQWLAFFARGKLQKLPVEGGAPVTICAAPSGRGGSWGEDGNIVAALQLGEGLSRVSSSGGAPQRLTDLKGEPATTSGHRSPQVLPDGKGVLFAASFLGGAPGALRVVDADGGKPRTLIENVSFGRYLAPGFLIYYQRGKLFSAPVDPKTLQLRGPAKTLVDRVASERLMSSSIVPFSLSTSGTLVYKSGLTDENYFLSWLDSSGRTEPILVKPGNYVTPRLSPDGKRLALALAQDGQQNIWIHDLGREIMTRLTFDAEPQDYPVWTDDADFLLFRSGGPAMLAWVHSDGTGKLAKMAGPEAGNAWPYSFSTGGKFLAFSQKDDSWAAPVERTAGAMRLGTPQLLAGGPGLQMAPRFSPDGRWVAYQSNESGRDEIYVKPFSGDGAARSGKWQVSSEGGHYPLWSRNGQIFYRNLERRVVAAAYTAKGDSFTVGKPHVWSGKQLANISGPTFDILPDGNRIVALFDAAEAKPETHLRVLLNVRDELRRRAASGAK